EGLAQENVALLDTNGRLLSEPVSSEMGAAGSQMEYRRELESYLASRAEGMLAQVLGPGRAVVRVTADLSFQRSKQKRETYLPEGRVALSEKSTTSRSTNTTPQGRGVPGIASNLAGKQPTLGVVGSTSTDETTQTDFAVSKITQEMEDRLG